MNHLSRQTAILLLCRVALAFSWIYQGAVPKLVCRSSGEIELLGYVIPVYRWTCLAVTFMGVVEIIFGLLFLVFSTVWLFSCNIALLAALLLYVLFFQPELFLEPFNPLTLNVALIALSLIAIAELKQLRRNDGYTAI